MSITISPRLTLTRVGSTDQFLLQLDSRVMYVGELLYIIVRDLQQQKPLALIAETVNSSSLLSRPLTVAQLESVIASKIVPLDLTDSAKSETKGIGKDIHLRVVLFRYPQIQALLGVLRHLFHPRLFWPMFWLAAAVSLTYVVPRWASAVATAPEGFTWLAFLGAMFLIMLCHELGHAAASWSFGVEPKEIGVGIYVCFPVFYADVTNVWKLPAQQRVIVNLGGVHVQLLLNLAVIGAAALSTDPSWRSYFLQLSIINLFSVVANLNPFFKFDGYWVIADMFHLPNLRDSSNAWLKSLVKRSPVARRPVLAAYSVARALFLGFVVVVMAKSIPEFLYNTYTFALSAWNAGSIAQGFYREAFQRTLGMALLLYTVGRLLAPLFGPAPATPLKAQP